MFIISTFFSKAAVLKDSDNCKVHKGPNPRDLFSFYLDTYVVTFKI